MPEIELPEIYRVAIFELSTCCGGNLLSYRYFDSAEHAKQFVTEFNLNPPESKQGPGYKLHAEFTGKVQ